jgi:hypothetical protein
MIFLYIAAGTIAVVGLWTFLGSLCARVEQDKALNWTLRDD